MRNLIYIGIFVLIIVIFFCIYLQIKIQSLEKKINSLNSSCLYNNQSIRKLNQNLNVRENDNENENQNSQIGNTETKNNGNNKKNVFSNPLTSMVGPLINLMSSSNNVSVDTEKIDKEAKELNRRVKLTKKMINELLNKFINQTIN